ncbi:beta-propeller fold lactonase family protein [Rhodoferax sp.]|uniref:YncE family protein n=1 Tax=Rhodoferax sp. TaxID=50421 RepID=UPI00283E13C4|nr:beta-propeller fold lactonase family protein [Rhodoferax sp.]MDR3368141.1 beta-propeller fold lactonase family protein [Rhodoferax sp.]
MVAALLAAGVVHAQEAHNDVVVVLDSGDARISLIDQTSHKVIDSFATGKEPHHLMATPDNRDLIVADAISNDLRLLDPRTGRSIGSVSGIADPYQIGFSPNHRWFMVNCLRLNRVDIYRYDNGKFTLAKRIPFQSSLPSHMAFTADSRTVYVTLQNANEVAAIDLDTQKVLWTMKVGDTPAGLWLTPGGDKTLLVALTGSNAVVAVDLVNHTIIKRIVTGNAAHNFRSMADGRHVLVSNRVSNTISIVDMLTLTKVGEIDGLRPGPDDMELSADRRWLWVTFRFDRSVGVIDMMTHKLVDLIRVGKSPHGLYFYNRAPFYDNLPGNTGSRQSSRAVPTEFAPATQKRS